VARLGFNPNLINWYNKGPVQYYISR